VWVAIWSYSVLPSSPRFGVLAAHSREPALKSLSERPLALFGMPSFAAVAAIVTMAYSRCVLMAASRERMTTREMVELAARVGRTSQRMLFLPVLGATLLSGITSRLALGLAQAVAVPLAFLYVGGSLLFLCGEMRTWRITSRDLLSYPRRQNIVSYSEAVDVFSPERVLSGDCSICLEPFPEATVIPDVKEEKVDKPIRVAVQVRLENGPRDWLRRPIHGCLEVSEAVHSEVGGEASIQNHRSDSTKHGEWRLVVNTGSVYRVRLINPDGARVVTEFTLHACLADSASNTCNCRGAADVRLELTRSSEPNGVVLSSGPLSWFFDGQRRHRAEAQSEVQLSATQADALDLTRGMPSLEMPLPATRPESAGTPPVLLRTLRCGHTFHEHCIAEWCRQSTRQAARCPLCREVLRGRGRVLQILF